MLATFVSLHRSGGGAGSLQATAMERGGIVATAAAPKVGITWDSDQVGEETRDRKRGDRRAQQCSQRAGGKEMKAGTSELAYVMLRAA